MNDEDVSSDSGSDEESRMIRQQERLYTDPLSDLTSEISLLLPTKPSFSSASLPQSRLPPPSFYFSLQPSMQDAPSSLLLKSQASALTHLPSFSSVSLV